jgi:hypothetical protein
MAVRNASRVFLAVFVLSGLILAGTAALAADPKVGNGAKANGSPFKEEATTPKADTSNIAPLPGGDSVGQAAAAATSAPCNTGALCGDSLCGPPGRLWIRADYLTWWTNGAHLPPLVTESPSGTPLAQAGVLGFPTTTVLFGDGTVNTDARSGWKWTMGYWLDACQTWGIQADYWDLGGNGTEFFTGSTTTGDPIIARPFFDVNPATGLPREASELVSFPNLSSGTIRVSAHDYFQSAGVSVRHPLCMGQMCGTSCGTSCGTGCDTGCGTSGGTDCGASGGASCGRATCRSCCCRVDLIVGYRYYRLSDDVTIAEHIDGLPNSVIRDTSIDVVDAFRARNDFHGGEIGLVAQRYCGPWSFELMAKMAIGNNHQVVTINGNTTVTQPGQSITNTGGLLAQGTNIGPHIRDDFVVIPQLGLEVGYQVTCRMRAYLGYNLLYWAQVARAGDQITEFVDSGRLPGRTGHNPILPFPDYDYHGSSFFAHGINAGLEYRF